MTAVGKWLKSRGQAKTKIIADSNGTGKLHDGGENVEMPGRDQYYWWFLFFLILARISKYTAGAADHMSR